MPDPAQRRLLEDLEGMERLKAQCNGMMEFEVSRNLRKYTVTIREIEGFKGANAQDMRKESEFVFTITLHTDHPHVQPLVVFSESVFHPNIYQGGRLCTDWNSSTSLKDFVIDVARAVNYDIVNPGSPANSDAASWYVNNKQKIRELLKKADFPPKLEGMIMFYQEVDDKLVFL